MFVVVASLSAHAADVLHNVHVISPRGGVLKALSSSSRASQGPELSNWQAMQVRDNYIHNSKGFNYSILFYNVYNSFYYYCGLTKPELELIILFSKLKWYL